MMLQKPAFDLSLQKNSPRARQDSEYRLTISGATVETIIHFADFWKRSHDIYLQMACNRLRTEQGMAVIQRETNW
jgi:hypothetical protein